MQVSHPRFPDRKPLIQSSSSPLSILNRHLLYHFVQTIPQARISTFNHFIQFSPLTLEIKSHPPVSPPHNVIFPFPEQSSPNKMTLSQDSPTWIMTPYLLHPCLVPQIPNNWLRIGSEFLVFTTVSNT